MDIREREGTAWPAAAGTRIDSAARRAGVLALALAAPVACPAYEVNDSLSVGASLTGIVQHGDFGGAGLDDTTRGAFVTDLGVNFHPAPAHEFDVVVSLAAGNALNAVSPLSLAPFSDDLEDDLDDINGRGRDYLLTAWYRFTATFSEETSLGLSGGLIDASAYLDDNAFANDELGQFMNEVFVNNPVLNLPSYDVGVAAELELPAGWSSRAVWMQSETGAGRTYHYFGGQIGYTLGTGLGEGTYRLVAYTTSEDFAAARGPGSESLAGLGLSLDQRLGDALGVFLRIGWQDDAAAVTHEWLYSAGLMVSGAVWSRPDDAIGIAYARLEGGSGTVEHTDAFEVYGKVQLTPFADLTVDFQYVADDGRAAAGDPDGALYGLRLNAFF